MMNRETLAAIDIGSNAIRLLINYVEEENGGVAFKKAAYLRVPIRLGEDVFTDGAISEAKIDRFKEAMLAFSHLMKSYNVQDFRACATSAMREAKNGAEVVKAIKESSGIGIEIISGTEEAETIFEAGDLAGIMNAQESYLFVDVGGGSTELTLYSNRKRVESKSFPLGTVRMLSGAVDKAEEKAFKKWLSEFAKNYTPTTIIGSGGNINKVHKLLAKRDKESLNYVELRLLYDQLKDISFDDRIKKMGLNTYRADVIMPAMKIFLTVCKYCSINQIIVPRVGLADGVIHGLYINRKRSK
ncbi:MAG: hypothetical protein R3Y50_00730 [Rikenellaceae bacterium]